MRHTHVLLLASIVVVSSALPLAVFGADFVPLSPNLPIAGNGSAWTGGLNNFINNLLGVAVAVSAVLAVIMVAVGGIRKMTTASVLDMGNANEQITNALGGLVLVLSSILILKTINPNIISLDLFSSGATRANTTASQTGTPATGQQAGAPATGQQQTNVPTASTRPGTASQSSANGGSATTNQGASQSGGATQPATANTATGVQQSSGVVQAPSSDAAAGQTYDNAAVDPTSQPVGTREDFETQGWNY